MSPADLALLHALCFEVPRPWKEAEFSSLLDNPAVFLCTAPQGFALGRIAGPEVELLTLAVAPDARRRGTGKDLMQQFEAQARRQEAQEAFLEVAQTNTGARRLYAACGYTEKGHRKDYYAGPDGTRISAIVMAKPL